MGNENDNNPDIMRPFFSHIYELFPIKTISNTKFCAIDLGSTCTFLLTEHFDKTKLNDYISSTINIWTINGEYIELQLFNVPIGKKWPWRIGIYSDNYIKNMKKVYRRSRGKYEPILSLCFINIEILKKITQLTEVSEGLCAILGTNAFSGIHLNSETRECTLVPMNKLKNPAIGYEQLNTKFIESCMEYNIGDELVGTYDLTNGNIGSLIGIQMNKKFKKKLCDCNHSNKEDKYLIVDTFNLSPYGITFFCDNYECDSYDQSEDEKILITNSSFIEGKKFSYKVTWKRLKVEKKQEMKAFGLMSTYLISCLWENIYFDTINGNIFVQWSIKKT